MAGAMPQTLGAKKALSGRQVIALSRGGGLSRLLGGLLTAVQENIPIKVVVFNNSSLGFVDLEMKADGVLDAYCDMGDDVGSGRFRHVRSAASASRTGSCRSWQAAGFASHDHADAQRRHARGDPASNPAPRRPSTTVDGSCRCLAASSWLPSARMLRLTLTIRAYALTSGSCICP
jgi:Thiamine pyrophosphate enzyme, C-terminal TPP binding domain